MRISDWSSDVCSSDRNVTEADDLVQETLVKALAAQDQFTLGTNLKAWAFTIMRRIRGMQARRTAATFEPIDDEQADRDLNFAVAPRQEAGLALDDLDRAVERLPDGQWTGTGRGGADGHG